MGNVRVVISKEPRSKVHKVEPGKVKVRQGETLEFCPEGTGIQIFVPKTGLFNKRRSFTVGAGKRRKLAIPEDAPLGGYAYAVYCEKSKHFAVGGSDPEIIIRKRST